MAYLGLLGCAWPARGRREVWGEERWRWGLGVVLVLAGLYLPVYVKAVDGRYMQPAWPFVVVAALGVGGLVGRRFGRGEGFERGWGGAGAGRAARLIPVLVGLWLAWPYGSAVVRAWEGRIDPASLYAQDLAERLRGAGVKGPMAGHGLVAGGRVGLLTAFLVGQPWYGERPGAGAEEFVTSGARVIVVGRRQAAAALLAADARVEDLDGVLFRAGEDADDYALKVFRLREGG